MCGEVVVYTVCGKQARKLMRKEMIENRRKRLLLRLIKERRANRKVTNNG